MTSLELNDLCKKLVRHLELNPSLRSKALDEVLVRTRGVAGFGPIVGPIVGLSRENEMPVINAHPEVTSEMTADINPDHVTSPNPGPITSPRKESMNPRSAIILLEAAASASKSAVHHAASVKSAERHLAESRAAVARAEATFDACMEALGLPTSTSGLTIKRMLQDNAAALGESGYGRA